MWNSTSIQQISLPSVSFWQLLLFLLLVEQLLLIHSDTLAQSLPQHQQQILADAADADAWEQLTQVFPAQSPFSLLKKNQPVPHFTPNSALLLHWGVLLTALPKPQHSKTFSSTLLLARRLPGWISIWRGLFFFAKTAGGLSCPNAFPTTIFCSSCLALCWWAGSKWE